MDPATSLPVLLGCSGACSVRRREEQNRCHHKVQPMSWPSTQPQCLVVFWMPASASQMLNPSWHARFVGGATVLDVRRRYDPAMSGRPAARQRATLVGVRPHHPGESPTLRSSSPRPGSWSRCSSRRSSAPRIASPPCTTSSPGGVGTWSATCRSRAAPCTSCTPTSPPWSPLASKRTLGLGVLAGLSLAYATFSRKVGPVAEQWSSSGLIKSGCILPTALAAALLTTPSDREKTVWDQFPPRRADEGHRKPRFPDFPHEVHIRPGSRIWGVKIPLLGPNWLGRNRTLRCGESEHRGPGGPRRGSAPRPSISLRPDGVPKRVVKRGVVKTGRS